jgi:integrase
MQTITPELKILLSQLSQYANSEPSDLNLSELWGQYKLAKDKQTAPTTKKGDWVEVDRALKILKPETLELTTASASLLLAELLNRYSVSVVRKILLYSRAAAYWGIEEELLNSKNPYTRAFKNIPKIQRSNRSQKCFEKPEIEHILVAFASNEFCSKFSVISHSHSYYRGYVEFLNLTGFRPEEAIALTWGDIKNSKIAVNKAYSNGILKSTKTYEAREFPINSQLAKLLASLPKTQRLVFPSVQGGHIDQRNFRERYWKPIVKQLVVAGKVGEYLPTYNLRHGWITRMLRAGIDIATVAKLAGNTPDTIMKHYLATKTDVVLPEF